MLIKNFGANFSRRENSKILSKSYYNPITK